MKLRLFQLDAFAHRQAEWARQWQIEYTELYVAQQQASLVVDGAPFYLRGRIDRVDVHRETGERVVLDYKSSDTPSTPEKSHQTKGEWVDLQLALLNAGDTTATNAVAQLTSSTPSVVRPHSSARISTTAAIAARSTREANLPRHSTTKALARAGACSSSVAKARSPTTPAQP